VLVLGGTVEGRGLAGALRSAGHDVISSLAGRVANPRLPEGDVRVGGFGGVDGLAEYLDTQQISAVIDATHPFAARITANAAVACARTGTPLAVLRRPSWTPLDGDDWTDVPDLPAANDIISAMAPEAAVLLTVGRQGVGAFQAAPQRFWLRSVDPPAEPLPARCELILQRGPFTALQERQLFKRLRIDVLVTKNSGGPMTVAKLTMARELGLPVLMVTRPRLPDGVRTVNGIPAAILFIKDI
jgi:precorrin-6A/cobalt-precorrin-6A reductase